jgi:hypothetical protein
MEHAFLADCWQQPGAIGISFKLPLRLQQRLAQQQQ